jgi:GDP-6-deoxy-D-talose 4-dehydrogenase
MKPLVLITGIEGFTGALMRKELESNGFRVVGTTLADAGPDDRVLDIESADACKAVVGEIAPDYVIHLAGISFVQSDPARLYSANVVGTVNLLEALAAAPKPPKKVVLASSANIYGNREGDRIAETEEPRPANHYAVSKLAMEKMAGNFYDLLPIIITRPFNYTGVGQSTNFLIPKIVSHFARRAASIELGNVGVERDFSDVRMVVEVYRKLLGSPARSIVVNICTGKAVSLAGVIEMMEEIAGYRIEVRVNPAFVRPNDIKHLTGDPRAMNAAIGPVDTRPLRTTLEDMYRSFQ